MILRDGTRELAILRDGEPPRADERPVRFGGAEEATRFLERVVASARGASALRDLLPDGFAATRVRDAEVPRILAPRFASGEIRVVELHARTRLLLGMDAYVLLHRAERPRRGESVLAFFSAEQAEHFLQRMWDDLHGRRPLEAELRRAVSPGDPRTLMRDLATRLVTGSVRMARVAAT